MESNGTFRFRRALSLDKGSVETLCAKIWEGEDYIPRCFDDWVADQAGEFTLCFVGDQLAGLSKLTWLGPGEAWLEGLRKDPDLPVKGLGTALCRRYLTHLARTEGLRCVRFSTYFENHASIRLNEAMGFERMAVASLKALSQESLNQRSGPFTEDPRVRVIRDADLAMPFIRESGWFGSLIHQAWRSFSWSETLFQDRYLAPGHCLGILEDGVIKALAACLVDPMKGEGTLPFFDAENPSCAQALLAAVERRLAQSGALEANAIVPPGGTRALRLLDTHGWRSWDREEDYFVYELPLEKLAAYRD